MWNHPWPADIITDLVSSTNREGEITNSDLELAALVLHEATLLFEISDTSLLAHMSSVYPQSKISWMISLLCSVVITQKKHIRRREGDHPK